MYEIMTIASVKKYGVYYVTSEIFTLVKSFKTRKQAERWIEKHS